MILDLASSLVAWGLEQLGFWREEEKPRTPPRVSQALARARETLDAIERPAPRDPTPGCGATRLRSGFPGSSEIDRLIARLHALEPAALAREERAALLAAAEALVRRLRPARRARKATGAG